MPVPTWVLTEGDATEIGSSVLDAVRARGLMARLLAAGLTEDEVSEKAHVNGAELLSLDQRRASAMRFTGNSQTPTKGAVEMASGRLGFEEYLTLSHPRRWMNHGVCALQTL
jgi:hypothetical protein